MAAQDDQGLNTSFNNDIEESRERRQNNIPEEAVPSSSAAVDLPVAIVLATLALILILSLGFLFQAIILYLYRPLGSVGILLLQQHLQSKNLRIIHILDDSRVIFIWLVSGYFNLTRCSPYYPWYVGILEVCFISLYGTSLVWITSRKILLTRLELMKKKPNEASAMRCIMIVIVCCSIWAFCEFMGVDLAAALLLHEVVDVCLSVGVLLFFIEVCRLIRRQPAYRQVIPRTEDKDNHRDTSE